MVKNVSKIYWSELHTDLYPQTKEFHYLVDVHKSVYNYPMRSSHKNVAPDGWNIHAMYQHNFNLSDIDGNNLFLITTK